MFTLNCKGRLLVIDQPLIMGIINTTPDSFYEGSRFMFVDQILRQAERMLKDGADILDIGGQSTRPGSDRLPISEEKEHVVFLLWGKFAQEKRVLIDETKHLILRAAHPSPLSASAGFFGCRHFSKANQYLTKHGIDPIDWRL